MTQAAGTGAGVPAARSDGAPAAAGATGTEDAPNDRVLTVPNALSMLRLVGVPLFLWLVLGPHEDGYALVVLLFSGASDYLDGKLARAWNQVSKVGALLDPFADRLYIVSTLVALALRHIIPWWLAVALLVRDLILLALVPLLRSRLNVSALPVHFLGKAATFNLLYAFPALLLAAGRGELATVARPIGWAFAAWGSVLYWWAGVLYVVQVAGLTWNAPPTGRPLGNTRADVPGEGAG